MQNPDMFEQLTNVAPPVQGDIDRRWGYGLTSQFLLTGVVGLANPVTLSLYQNTQSGNRQLVYAGGTHSVVATNESGQVTNTSIFAPVTQPPSALRMMNSRSYGYFSDGAAPDYLKWDGSFSTSKWGIDINQVAGLIVGPNGPGTTADLGAGAGPGNTSTLNPTAASSTGGSAWASPNNIFASDGQYASQVIAVQTSTGFLQGSNYGFTIPTNATITGIQVTIRRFSASVPDNNIGHTGFSQDNGVFLMNSGVRVGIDHSKANNFWQAFSPANVVYGSSTDLWGATWTPADIMNAGFGAAVRAFNQETNAFFTSKPSVDWIGIQVFYTTPNTGSWSLPNNIQVQDGQVASAIVSTSATSEIRATNFGLVPGGANGIAGIQVDIKCSVIGGAVNLQPILVKGTGIYGIRKTSAVTSSNLGFVSFGGPTDLWGATSWSSNDINSLAFGMQFLASTLTGTATLQVDYIQITIFSLTGAAALGAPVGGSITLSVGREYAMCFENSITGHLSAISLFSPSTGPLTSQNQPLTGMPVSSDPQVDKKVLLATADGGDETTLYFVTELANATTTYTDSTTEPSLLLANVYLNQDATGTTLGVADNTPPPVGAINPLKHRGRVYMHDSTKLYYSKSEADLVTSSATLCGKFEESWPPLNYFDSSAGAETAKGLLSDGQVLYIGTDKRIIRLFGDGPSNFTEPESLFLHTGIANQDVWKIIFMEGNPLGAMWLTPDRRVIGSDFNTYQDVGLPVQNILDSMNPAAYQQTSWAAYVGISNWNLYILAIPTGSNVQPDTFLVFDLKGKKWYQWIPTDLMLGGLYNITTTGQPTFTTVSISGSAYNWDPSLLQDRVNDTAVNFPVTIRTSWQDFTDAAARKYLNEIEVITGDPEMLVTVHGASSLADFQNPHIVVSQAPLNLKPRGEFFVPLAGKTTRDRYYRFTFESSDFGTDLIRGWNVEGMVINRI